MPKTGTAELIELPVCDIGHMYKYWINQKISALG